MKSYTLSSIVPPLAGAAFLVGASVLVGIPDSLAGDAPGGSEDGTGAVVSDDDLGGESQDLGDGSEPAEGTSPSAVEIRLYAPRAQARKGYFAEADSLCRAAIAKFEETYGPESMAVVEGASLLLEIMWRSNDTAGKDGRAWGDRAIRIAESHVGERGIELADLLNNYGAFLHADGDAERAEEMYRRCLDIREENDGPEAPSVARVLNNMGTLHVSTGRLEEAEKAHRRAIDILTVNFGQRHRSLATSYNNMANVVGRMGRREEAVAYFEKALALREELDGENHIAVARVLFNLGGLNFELGNTDVAREQFERAMSIQLEFFGEDNLVCAPGLHNLANLYAAIGEYAEARSRLEQVVTIYEIHSPGSEDLAASVNDLGRLTWKGGWRQDATQSLEYAYALRSELYGAGDPALERPLTGFPWVRVTPGDAPATLALEPGSDAFVLAVPVGDDPGERMRVRVVDARDETIADETVLGSRMSRPLVFLTIARPDLEPGTYHVRVEDGSDDTHRYTFELRASRDAG